MPVRSVVDIDVNDGSFQKFSAIFDKYRKALKDSNYEWERATKNIDKSAKSFHELVNQQIAAMGVRRLMEQVEKAADRRLRGWADAWKTVADHTKDVVTNIGRATSLLARWGSLTGLVGGLLGAGGIFGLDRLAQGVAAGRRGSMGMGISYGQQKAFELNFGRFVDPNAMLGNVANALTNKTSPGYVGLMSAGMSPAFLDKKNAADVSAELLRRIPQLFGNMDKGLIGPKLQAMQLDQFLSQQDVIRYLGAKPEERKAQENRYRTDTRTMDLDPGTQRVWIDFMTQISRAGQNIENVFIKGLTGLTKPLEGLSESFEKTLTTFLKSDQLKVWIDDLGHGIEHFGKYILTPEFQTGVKDFAEGVITVGRAIARVAAWFSSGATDPTTGKRMGGYLGGPTVDAEAERLRKDRESGKASGWSQFLDAVIPGRTTQMDQEGLLRMVRKLEGSGDREVSKAGAIGRYQITPDTARTYGYDPNRLMDPAYNEKAARAILDDLSRRYKGNTDEILAGYNAGPGGANRFKKAGDNPSVLPGETQGYLNRAHGMTGYAPNVKIDVNNNTGGNAVVSTSQVAQ